ncbi:helix-turn-helix domain-containing protein [Dysgonomonas macrotermitis]|uniref:Helix-turn-helix domain-containing protein n=1 Tax=Dysgonomonas macrotermitis TaxID=1346286 RepID=A0A1M4USG5_9BACT|nr:helix-turn-helix domain-containing protein [Dysgonomonas macrotermitis]SHE59691.1 Helix-turn-helix domain-containing protein [Dysgonomonas macrotermitis]
MDVHDILNYRSSEILDLFHDFEKINEDISGYVDTHKHSLSDESFLGNKEVCRLLKISPRTLQDYRDKRLIAFYKLEGKIRYKMSDILRMLENNYYDVWKQKR